MKNKIIYTPCLHWTVAFSILTSGFGSPPLKLPPSWRLWAHFCLFSQRRYLWFHSYQVVFFNLMRFILQVWKGNPLVLSVRCSVTISHVGVFFISGGRQMQLEKTTPTCLGWEGCWAAPSPLVSWESLDNWVWHTKSLVRDISTGSRGGRAVVPIIPAGYEMKELSFPTWHTSSTLLFA